MAVTPRQQHVWHSRFGAIVIEVEGQVVYVNGEAVHPAGTAARPGEEAPSPPTKCADTAPMGPAFSGLHERLHLQQQA